MKRSSPKKNVDGKEKVISHPKNQKKKKQSLRNPWRNILRRRKVGKKTLRNL